MSESEKSAMGNLNDRVDALEEKVKDLEAKRFPSMELAFVLLEEDVDALADLIQLTPDPVKKEMMEWALRRAKKAEERKKEAKGEEGALAAAIEGARRVF